MPFMKIIIIKYVNVQFSYKCCAHIVEKWARDLHFDKLILNFEVVMENMCSK